jgi:hypothetical protein
MLDYPWDDMHHSYFLPQQPHPSNQYVVESKDFIPMVKLIGSKILSLSLMHLKRGIWPTSHLPLR